MYPPLHAKSLYELNHDDAVYLAEIHLLTNTGQGYSMLALIEHAEKWKEVITPCFSLAEKQEFDFSVAVVIRPSGDVGTVSLGAPNDDKLIGFVNCIGENLMRSTYPAHPFPAFYFKFQLVNSFENFVRESSVRKKIAQSQLVGLWRSTTNNSYLKIDDMGDVYYCLFNKGMAIKVVAKGLVDENNNFLWGKFFLLQGSEVFDLKDDVKKDMGQNWSTTIEAGVLHTYLNGLPESSYLKAEKMDLVCD